jgi:hypothetical protein
MVLGCPNLEGGCGRPSTVYRGVKVCKQLRIVKVAA